MRILVCNDDGVDAPGILALAVAMKRLGDVTVVAPDGQRSASSHAISLHGRLYVQKVHDFSAGIEAWSVSGTPVDCVKWAVSRLGCDQPFDFMVSGINEGQNLAVDVLYSGTLAAAGEAALLGVPAVAFSLAGSGCTFDQASSIAADVADWCRRAGLPPDTFLNVNIPSMASRDTPWAITQLGARSYHERFRKLADDDGREYYTYAGDEIEQPEGADTDVAAVRSGKVSITPLSYRFTNHEMIDSLKAWLTRVE
ncbi:MAG: 5'/3'-nucleotidase SurE [Alicyclobacillaceae bacterium]|nr:5'/3'-nucleotidase SurE [Alicyclobacillaceae bacterium]